MVQRLANLSKDVDVSMIEIKLRAAHTQNVARDTFCNMAAALAKCSLKRFFNSRLYTLLVLYMNEAACDAVTSLQSDIVHRQLTL